MILLYIENIQHYNGKLNECVRVAKEDDDHPRTNDNSLDSANYNTFSDPQAPVNNDRDDNNR